MLGIQLKEIDDPRLAPPRVVVGLIAVLSLSLTIIGILMSTLWVEHWQKEIHFYETALTTQGAVIAHRREAIAYTGSDGEATRTTYKFYVTFRFIPQLADAENERVTREEEVTPQFYARYPIDSSVTVYYLPSDPTIARLRGMTESPTFWFDALFVPVVDLVALAGLVFLLGRRLNWWIRKRADPKIEERLIQALRSQE